MSDVDPERVFAIGKIVYMNETFAIYIFNRDGKLVCNAQYNN